MKATFRMEFPADLLKKIQDMGDVDEWAPPAIAAAMPIIEAEMQKQLSVHRDTGEMITSIKSTRPQKVKSGGFFSIARPTGKDAKGVRNMEKLAYIEHGTIKQMARPVLRSIINRCSEEVVRKIQHTFEDETRGTK